MRLASLLSALLLVSTFTAPIPADAAIPSPASYFDFAPGSDRQLITYAQLVERGTRVVYGSFSAALDMRYGQDCVGTPEMSLMSSCLPQLAHRYDLPSWMAGL